MWEESYDASRLSAVIDGMIRVQGPDTALHDVLLDQIRALEELGELTPGTLGGQQDGCLAVPRGLRSTIGALPILDARTTGNVVDLHIDESKLDSRAKYQEPFLAKCLANGEEGILVAPTGSGKTVIMAMMLSKLRTKALVLTHRETIAQQICSTISNLLGLEPGFIGDGIRNIREVTVGMIQSVRSFDPLLREVGALIIDEAHHCRAPSYLKVLANCPARFRYGLTATIKLRRGVEKLIFAALGPVLGEIPVGALQEAGHLNKGFYRPIFTTAVASILSFVQARCWYYKKLQKDPDAKPCPAPCTYPQDDDIEACVMKKGYYSWVYKILAEDQIRNQRVLEEALKVVIDHPWTVMLTHLRKHAVRLRDMLVEAGLTRAFLALGGGSANERSLREKSIQDYIQHGGILVATSGAIGEGFDAPKTSCLVRAMPSGGNVPVRQHTGRIMRPQQRPSLIVDFVDIQIPWLKGMWWARRKIYQSLGFVEEPKNPA